MKQQIDNLKDFHDQTKSHWQDVPTLRVPQKVKISRAKLIREEAAEVVKAIEENEPIEDLAKELSDLIYVTLGTVGSYGLSDKFEEVFAAVHQSNLSKVGKDGKVLYNSDGKVIKPPSYRPPDIKEILGVK